MVHVYSEILLHLKKNEFKLVVMKWMNLEPVVQGEVNQKEKNKYHILRHVHGI